MSAVTGSWDASEVIRELDRVQIQKASLACPLLVWRSHFVPRALIARKRLRFLSMLMWLGSVETGLYWIIWNFEE